VKGGWGLRGVRGSNPWNGEGEKERGEDGRAWIGTEMGGSERVSKEEKGIIKGERRVEEKEEGGGLISIRRELRGVRQRGVGGGGGVEGRGVRGGREVGGAEGGRVGNWGVCREYGPKNCSGSPIAR